MWCRTCLILLLDLLLWLGVRPWNPRFCSYFSLIDCRVKFLKPFDYSTVVNCAFIFRTRNVFVCFCNIIVRFEPEKHKLPYPKLPNRATRYQSTEFFKTHSCNKHIAFKWSNTVIAETKYGKMIGLFFVFAVLTTISLSFKFCQLGSLKVRKILLLW